jgi:hypothetical protein
MAKNGKLTAHLADVRTDRDRGEEFLGELLGLALRQTFKDAIFKTRQPFGKTQFDRIAGVIVDFQRAANGAALGAVLADFEADALRQMLQAPMLSETLLVFGFDGRVVVEGLQFGLLDVVSRL